MPRLSALSAMTLALALAASPALAAKAARPKPEPRPAAKPAPAQPRPAPVSDPSPLPLHGLLSLTEGEARARLGAPDVARTEGAGALWTYRLPDCALLVFFRATGEQPLRVSGAASGPRRRGQAPAPLDTCLSEALDRKGGDPAP